MRVVFDACLSVNGDTLPAMRSSAIDRGRACPQDNVRRHPFALFAFILSLVVIAGLAMGAQGVRAQAATRGEFNVDRLGGDYAALCVRNHEECAWQCSRDGRCRAWTALKYSVPRGQHGQQCDRAMTCYLKSTVPAARADSCCISGVMRPEFVNTQCRVGNSITRPGQRACFCWFGPRPGGHEREVAADYCRGTQQWR
ncbi:MAG: PAN domain-containing protein [Pseudorhodoplanes sp.]|nr:PAN domain-containing protein [Pseudorhodoplanes sp.]